MKYLLIFTRLDNCPCVAFGGGGGQKKPKMDFSCQFNQYYFAYQTKHAFIC
uniref:Uncharacterized protein n=1 Tax=Aegilops tauschii subsp. strangulata TaxID=200361 RepID=A0A452Y7E5_AEGTS